MQPWTFLILWIVSHVLQLVLGILAVLQKPDPTGDRRLGSLLASGLASIPPLFTLLLFVLVFVIGGSSNVSQLAGSEGFDLWRLWLHAWPLMFFGNPPAFLVLLVCACLPPYPPRRWRSTASRACGLMGAGFAWYTAITFVPDA